MPISTKKQQYLDQSATSVYAGMDSDNYPGATWMQTAYDNTNLFFTGFYLGKTSSISGPCCHPTSTWMPESSPGSVRTALYDMGWGFVPLYVGQQYNDPNCPSCNVLTSAQGTTDAQNAADLMSAAGFPDLSVVFLDVEAGGTLPSSFMDYIQAWINEINNATSYWAGAYCSYDQTAAQISAKVGSGNVTLYVFDLNIQGCKETSPFPTPSPSSAYSGAKSLQYAQGCTISNGTSTITADLDSSFYTDPSRNPTQ